MIKSEKSPLVLAFMGGFASGSATASKLFNDELLIEQMINMIEEERGSLLREDVVFHINKTLRKRQIELIKKNKKELTPLSTKCFRIYQDYIKYEKIKCSIRDDDPNLKARILDELCDLKYRLMNYLIELDKNIDSIKKYLAIKNGLIFDKSNDLKHGNTVNKNYKNIDEKLFNIALDRYWNHENEQVIKNYMHNYISNIVDKRLKSEQQTNRFKDNVSLLHDEDYMCYWKAVEFYLNQGGNPFNAFNTIAFNKWGGDEILSKLDDIKKLISDIIKAIDDYFKENIKDLNEIYNLFTSFINTDVKKDSFSDMNIYRIYGQSKGNMIRLLEGNEIFMKNVFKKHCDSFDKEKYSLIIIETIRNKHEITYLKNHFANIHFIALHASKEERNMRVIRDALQTEWDGIKCRAPGYTRRDKKDLILVNMNILLEDISIDKKEFFFFNTPKSHGQQTEACLEQADIIIDSSNVDRLFGVEVYSNNLNYYFNKLLKYFLILKFPGYFKPVSDEIFMTHAYNISLRSGCLKRKVGAVIIDRNGKIVSEGYNNPPTGINPCDEREMGAKCERSKKILFIKSKCLISKGNEPLCTNNDCDKQKKCDPSSEDCLNCDHFESTVDQKCRDCIKSLLESNLSASCPIHDINAETKFSSYCRALHAEEKALLEFSHCRPDGKPYTFYTTTKPCYACIKRIIDMGFEKIVYKENYDDPLAKDIVNEYKNHITLKVFEGVTTNAFFRYYKSYT